ncbi:MAG: class I SAM-dependent methyltransferase [Phycisphaerae bacterium]|nr:class I SAM-dependent methyltransferase [Phycisphaerae bacterium]MCZ2400490.1 class I SAM-dependent methyltransferase [Phycisphaerae bacterium]
MAAPRLVLRRYLDPREPPAADARPIRDAVSIPLSELSARTHELPPRRVPVRVAAAADLAAAAVAALVALGRKAAPAEHFEYEAEDADGAEPAIGRLWSPTAFLEQVAPELPTGRALDVACGCGRDAVWLADRGWRVTAVDVLPDALDLSRDLERRYLKRSVVEWRQADLEAHAAIADLAAAGPFDLVSVFRYLNRPLLARVRDWLAPGGGLVCETFTTLHRERHGRPAREGLVLRPGELPALFSGWHIRCSDEGWHDDAHTARLWAEPRA